MTFVRITAAGEQRNGNGHAILAWLRERGAVVRSAPDGFDVEGLELSLDYQQRLATQTSSVAKALQEEAVGWVHIWDMGMLCKWVFAPGGASTAAMQFSAVARSQSAGARHFVLAMDSKVPTWRHQAFPDYKANRPPMTEEQLQALKKQTEATIELLPRAKVIRAPGWEADDICATVATRAKAAGFRAMVYSTDKDLLQLMPRGIRIHNGRHEVTAGDVVEKFGVHPTQLLDYFAIVGDSGDNLPGIKGLGKAAAVSILGKHKTFDEALAEAKIQFGMTDKPSASLRRFVEGEQAGRLSKRLVALDCNVPVGMPWETPGAERIEG